MQTAVVEYPQYAVRMKQSRSTAKQQERTANMYTLVRPTFFAQLCHACCATVPCLLRHDMLHNCTRHAGQSVPYSSELLHLHAPQTAANARQQQHLPHGPSQLIGTQSVTVTSSSHAEYAFVTNSSVSVKYKNAATYLTGSMQRGL
jgi:hypothetical protein